MASRNPSSSPSSFAMRSRSSPTSPRKSLICAPSRASVPLKPREDHPRERDAHGHNCNHFPAHASSQSVRPILSRPLSKTKLAAGAKVPLRPPALRPTAIPAQKASRPIATRGFVSAWLPCMSRSTTGVERVQRREPRIQRRGENGGFRTRGGASCDLSIGCSFGPGPRKLELSHNSNLGETE